MCQEPPSPKWPPISFSTKNSFVVAVVNGFFKALWYLNFVAKGWQKNLKLEYRGALAPRVMTIPAFMALIWQ